MRQPEPSIDYIYLVVNSSTDDRFKRLKIKYFMWSLKEYKWI